VISGKTKKKEMLAVCKGKRIIHTLKENEMAS